MKLDSHPFSKIEDGSKIIEIRLFDEKRKNIKLDDIIEFQCESDNTKTLQAKVVGLLNYKTFADLINDFPVSYFGDEDKEILVKRIYTFYTKEQEDKYSVLGIKIKLLSKFI